MTCETARITGLSAARDGVLALTRGCADDDEWDALIEQAFAIEDKIIETPAGCPADLKAKADLALASFDSDADETLRRVLTSLREDLIRFGTGLSA